MNPTKCEQLEEIYKEEKINIKKLFNNKIKGLIDEKL